METQPRGEVPGAIISSSAVRLLHEYTGRDATEAKTVINDDLVTVVFADKLTKGERRRVEKGHSDRVLHLRHDYQRAWQNQLATTVERQLDRKVIASMSDNHIDPDIAVEVFVLEPVGED